MKALAKRLCRLESRVAQRIAARQAFNAKRVLVEKIEGIAARLAAAGYKPIEGGPEADAVRLDIKQRLARILESARCGGGRDEGDQLSHTAPGGTAYTSA